MSNYFVDTSALAKRYLKEAGSTWVLSWVLPSAGNIVIVAELALVEMASLLARHQRQGLLTPANMTILQANFFCTRRKNIWS